MHTNDIQTTTASRIDLSVLEQELIAVEQKIKYMAGREIVLVIGNTGSGKSTLINYLQGRKLEQRASDETGTAWLETVDNSMVHSPRIGHGVLSQTDYPEAFECGKRYLLCDTSGYLDTRSQEKNLCTYLALQIVSRYAEKIKAIIAVIEIPALEAAKGNVGFESLRVINELFTQQNQLSKSTLFVFTKPETGHGNRVTQAQIIRRITSKIDALAESENQDNRKLHNILQVIVSNPDNVFVPNVLDNGQTRQTLFERIDASLSLSKDQLKLSIADREYAEFRELISQTARTYLTMMANKEAHENEIRQIERTKASNNDILTRLQSTRTQLEIQRGQRSLNLNSSISQVTNAQRYATDCASTVAKIRTAGPLFTWTNNTLTLNCDATFEADGSFTFSRDNEVLRLAGPLNQHSSNIARAAWETEIARLESRSQQAKEALVRAQANLREEETYNENIQQIARYTSDQTQADTRLSLLKQEIEQMNEKLMDEDSKYQLVARLNHFFGFNEAVITKFLTQYHSMESVNELIVANQQKATVSEVKVASMALETDSVVEQSTTKIEALSISEPAPVSTFRDSLNQHSFFKVNVPSNINDLLAFASIENTSTGLVQILFSDREIAKAFAAALLQVGMGNRQMSHAPKKVEPLEVGGPHEQYAIVLTEAECEALGIEENAVKQEVFSKN